MCYVSSPAYPACARTQIRAHAGYAGELAQYMCVLAPILLRIHMKYTTTCCGYRSRHRRHCVLPLISHATLEKHKPQLVRPHALPEHPHSDRMARALRVLWLRVLGFVFALQKCKEEKKNRFIHSCNILICYLIAGRVLDVVFAQQKRKSPGEMRHREGPPPRRYSPMPSLSPR